MKGRIQGQTSPKSTHVQAPGFTTAYIRAELHQYPISDFSAFVRTDKHTCTAVENTGFAGAYTTDLKSPPVKRSGRESPRSKTLVHEYSVILWRRQRTFGFRRQDGHLVAV